MALHSKRAHEVRDLVDVDGLSADGTGDSVRLPGMVNAYAFLLDVTADESSAADTLDVTVETRVGDAGWVDICSFTQHAGNAGAATYLAKVCTGVAESMFTDSALAAGNVRNLLGDEYRVDYAITDDSGDGEFTFTVQAIPM